MFLYKSVEMNAQVIDVNILNATNISLLNKNSHQNRNKLLDMQTHIITNYDKIDQPRAPSFFEQILSWNNKQIKKKKDIAKSIWIKLKIMHLKSLLLLKEVHH